MEEGASEFVKTDEPTVGGRTRRTIMGCCQGKPGGLSKAERDSRWRNTGIVGLRDSNLKVDCPLFILQLFSIKLLVALCLAKCRFCAVILLHLLIFNLAG